MTVRLRILLACLVFICICAAMAASAWRSQQRLSTLALDLYDHAFVAQDFLGRATVSFEQFAARRGNGTVTQAEQAGVLKDILGNLDIARSRALALKTRTVLSHVHDDLTALPALPAAGVPPALAHIMDGLAHAARRFSNDGLAQRDDADAAAASARRLLQMSLVGTLVGAAATGWLLTRGVVPPLRRATEDMARLCGGDVESEVRGAARRDEIGALCRSMSVFREALVTNRRMEADTAHLAETRRARQQALTLLSSEFRDHVGGQLNSVGGAVNTLQQTATNLSARSARMAERSLQVGELASGAAESARVVTEVVTQLAESGQEIAHGIADSAAATRLMQGEAEQARSLVDELGSVAAGVGTVVQLISGIAGRTNMLALNATIEAARAGESGRGFAVVAGEVKALARQTAQATDDIGHRIGAVRASAQRAMALIHAMADRIGSVERSSGAIAERIQRQHTSIDQINRTMVDAAGSIAEVAAGMQQLQNDVAENTGASSQVTETAGDVRERTDVLRKEVEYFIHATNEATDWRSFVRHDCHDSVTIASGSGPAIAGQMQDISRGGAAVACAAEMEPGMICDLVGLLPQRLPATVVQCKHGVLRLRFSRDEDVQNKLAAFMAERFGERQAA